MPHATTQAAPEVAGERSLVRAIGTVGLAASIINITVGGGIFRLPAVAAGSLGAAAPLAYLTCAIAFGFILICLADAGRRVSVTGGPYAYVEFAFGPFVGFLCGLLLWLVCTFAFAAVATVFASGMGELIPFLAGRAASALFLTLLFAGIAAVNVIGVRQGVRLNNLATAAKLLPLLLLIVLGAFAVRSENLVWQAPPQVSAVARASLVLVFAFAGVETALVPSGEVREPSRTVPRAILLAMLGITGLYVALQVVTQGILGSELGAANETPLADAAGRALGGWGRSLLLVGASISMFGYVGGMMLAVPRALYAFARDGFLPAALGRVHARYRTPWVAILVQALMVLSLAISSSFERLAVLATVSVLILYAACCAASWQLQRSAAVSGGDMGRVPLARVAPYLALGLIGWMLTGIHAAEWLAVGVCLAGGALIYLGSRTRRTQLVAASEASGAGRAEA